MVSFYVNKSDYSENGLLIRLICPFPIGITFRTKDEFVRHIANLKSSLCSGIFNFEKNYVTKSSRLPTLKGFWDSLQSSRHTSSIPTVSLWFNYDLNNEGCSPVIQLSQMDNSLMKLRIPVDFLSHLQQQADPQKFHDVLRHCICEYLDRFSRAALDYWEKYGNPPKGMKPYNYITDKYSITVYYPKNIYEDAEEETRKSIHEKLGLPTNEPLLRRGQALHPVPYVSRWLGPNNELLVCPHEALKSPSGNGTTYVVKGRYTYKHYLQDGMDDKNWGCAYRSLQTLISWLMWQGEVVPRRLPSFREIQSSLVRTGDKPKSFIGSRQWIGSLEVSFCLEELYRVQCRLLPVSHGADMGSIAAPQLAEHFHSGGGPVMIGGGQLAHTIIGVQLQKDDFTVVSDRSTSPRYLVLDPHFTGPAGNLKVVLDKGWCGWKDSSFWKSDVHYNLCFLPPIQLGRV
ncbi:UFM1 specific peptidase 2 [Paragonimus heterotremus]|uniref:UFM1 specific peptidase 2 n=1 Tax=Paragonimus heterotremus TaxID=100268 RepID=A0A8J4WQ17_9TREM|nr:UFM1 specific peptidase 2 [Paragonimus heterotremus]